ncbi:MAG: hypothetical protein AAFR37_19955 [Cyanobacteria bacterium J06628_3]
MVEQILPEELDSNRLQINDIISYLHRQQHLEIQLNVDLGVLLFPNRFDEDKILYR